MTVNGKKKISRRKPGEKSGNYYFSASTQDAVIRYQQAVIPQPDGSVLPDIEARNKIYVEEILPAFQTLVEFLINVYHYHVLYESKEDLRNECLEFLYGVLCKFDVTKGSTAFSYFNVVARNWLTIKSKQNAKNIQTYISLDNKDTMSKHELTLIEEYNVIPSIEDVLTSEETSKNLKEVIQTLQDRAKTDNEKICLKAIMDIVDQIDDVDLLSKRAVMLYIREITKLSSKQLSIVLSSLKKQYRTIKEERTR